MPRRSLSSLITLLALTSVVACSGGSGGKSDDGGTIPQISLSHDLVVEACARVAACGIEHARLADCVDDYFNRYVQYGQESLWASIYGCVNGAKGDCGVVRECLGFQRKPVQCNNATFKTRCEGEVAFNCDLLARWEQGIDCAKGGLKCGVKEAGTSRQAICGGGPCDPTKSRGACVDNRVHLCASGAIEINDCPKQGLQCRDNKALVCEGTGNSCLPANPQCDSAQNTLLDCVEGYLARRKCDEVPGKKVCKTGSNKCAGSGTDCSTSSDFDTCEADTLVVCVDGYTRRMDCKQLGFIGCQPTQYGATCKAEPVY